MPDHRPPAWLDEALRRATPRPDGHEAIALAPGAIAPIERMDGEGPNRLGLVLGMSAEERFSTVCLLSNEVEYAGPADVTLTPAETGLPYDAIAETDLTGPVWTLQLQEPVGSIDVASWGAAFDSFSPDLSDVPVERRGLRVVDPADSRWEWKEAELAELNEISFDCTATLIEGVASFQDPEVLALPGPEEDRFEWLRGTFALIDFMACQGIPFSAESLEIAGLPAESRLWPDGLGVDMLNAMSDLGVARVLDESSAIEPASPPRVSVAPARKKRNQDDRLSALLGLIARSRRRSFRLDTSKDRWRADQLPEEVIAKLGGRGYCRLIPTVAS